jgi:pilus assembly protein Flp/PilA
MMPGLLKSFLSDRHGATAIEYGLLAALISIGMLAGLTALGDGLDNTLTTLSTQLEPKE